MCVEVREGGKDKDDGRENACIFSAEDVHIKDVVQLTLFGMLNFILDYNNEEL